MTTTQTTINGIDRNDLFGIIDSIKQQPALGAATFSAKTRWVDAQHVTTRIDDCLACGSEQRRARSHQIPTDWPTAMQGKDRGPTPVEAALTALSACVATSLVAHASAKGIAVERLEVSCDGDIDLQGFLGLDPTIPVRPANIRLAIEIDTDLTAADTEQFVHSALRFSPVLDLFRQGTEVQCRVGAGD